MSKPPGRPITIPWRAIIADYRAGERNITQLSKKYNVNRQGVATRKAADARAGKSWDDPDPRLSEPKSDNIIQFPAAERSKEASAGVGASANPYRAQYRGGGDRFIDAEPLIDNGAADEPIARVEDVTVDPLEQSAMRVSRLALAAAEGHLRLVIRGKIAPGQHQSLADVVDKAVATAERAVKLARLNAGKSVGDASAESSFEDDGELRIISECLPVPERPRREEKAS